jgi:hypothetical protein
MEIPKTSMLNDDYIMINEVSKLNEQKPRLKFFEHIYILKNLKKDD